MSAQDLLVLELKKGRLYMRTCVHYVHAFSSYICTVSIHSTAGDTTLAMPASLIPASHMTPPSPPLQHTDSVPNQEHQSPHNAPRPVGGTRKRGGPSNIKRGGVHGYHILWRLPREYKTLQQQQRGQQLPVSLNTSTHNMQAWYV